MKWPDRSLLAQASSQHGLLLRSQLDDAGWNRDAVARLIRRGLLERRSTVVLAVVGSPPTREQRRMAAVLDGGPGAALAFRSAAAVWGMYRRSEGRPHVIRPRRDQHRRTPPLGIVHTSRRLPRDHVVTISGIPVTTPARTVVDLALVDPLGRVARMLDTAWGHRLLTIGELAGVLADVRSRGRRGVRVLDHLIAERLGHRAPESGLEVRFEQILRRGGLPSMSRQVDIGDEAGWICRADFARLDDRLVGFIDSDTYHRALLDRQHDDSQTRRLRAAGLRVFRVSDAAILYDPRAVTRAVRAAA